MSNRSQFATRRAPAACPLSSGSPATVARLRVNPLWRLPLLVTTLLCSLFASAPHSSAQTAMQTYVEAMQPGTNWGNTLDAVPNETSWGAPMTTQPMIQGLVAKGYKSLRLPVTWNTHMGPAPDYTIDPAYMDRVAQVVQWALDADLYVMLNLHHDGWVNDMGHDHDAVLDRYQKVWLQIANRFKDHSPKLSFESKNEPGFHDASGRDLPRDQMQAMLDELNTAFFNLVRGTGGGNATRPLVLPSVYTSADQTDIDSLKATITKLNDPNLIATVHYYGWFPFSVNLGNEPTFDETSIYWVHKPFDDVYNTLVADGIPVIVGEFSVLSGSWIQRGEQLKYHEYVQAYGRSKGMAMMLWDTGGIYNRTAADWANPDLGNILMHAVTGRALTAESDLLFVDASAPVGDTVVNLQLNDNTLVAVEDNGTTLTPSVDYTLSGETLLLKAHVLAKYATGAYGEKATLKLHSSTGPAWKIFVRYASTPVPAAVTTTTKIPFALPVAFNGDLLATMESKYADGSNAGPIDWTSFQQFGSDFRPNYANNTIEFTANFFGNAKPGIVNLDLHFWSGKIVKYQLEIKERSPEGGIESAIYTDDLAFGWYSWGWTSYDTGSTAQAHGGTKSISVTPGGYGGVVFQTWAPQDTSTFRTLTFWVHGGTTGGQTIGIGPIRGDVWGPGSTQIPVPVANTWTKVEIPLAALGVEGSPNITGFYFQHWSGDNGPTFYIDDLTLTTALTTAVMDITGQPAPVITSTTSASGQYGVPFSYTITAVNNPVSFSATGLPAGLAIDANTGAISGTPLAAGSYLVTLGATNAAGTNTEILALDIAPAQVAITLPSGSPFGATFSASYNGAPQNVTITTNPASIPVIVTYNGSATAPTLPGTYQVAVTSADPNYTGSAQGTLVITSTALVRHAPTINGDLDGSLQLLSGESFTLNSSGSVASDVLVPGTPIVRTNGHPTFAGVAEADGAIAPSNYSLTLNSGAVVRYVVRRVDPIALPVVTVNVTGTRDVTLNNANQNAGDLATVRSLTLNGNSHLTLGTAGATEATVYELQRLTLNGNASVQIVGPVKLKLASGLMLNGTLGSAEHPEWLQLEIANGGLTVNGNGVVNAIVTAPNGSVTINGTVHGRVTADRLTINGSGVLEDPNP